MIYHSGIPAARAEPGRGDNRGNWSYLISQLAFTVMAASLGLIISVVFSLGLGATIAGSRWVDRILSPWLLVAHAAPKVVIAPPMYRTTKSRPAARFLPRWRLATRVSGSRERSSATFSKDP